MRRNHAMSVQVDVGRIEAICRAKFKVDADTILDPESPQALIALVRKLQSLQVGNITSHRLIKFLWTGIAQVMPEASFKWPTTSLLCSLWSELFVSSSGGKHSFGFQVPFKTSSAVNVLTTAFFMPSDALCLSSGCAGSRCAGKNAGLLTSQTAFMP